jgi:hypothetical protein
MAVADYEPTSESCLGAPQGTASDGPSVPQRWGRFFGHRASAMRNRAMAGVVAPGQYCQIASKCDPFSRPITTPSDGAETGVAEPT